VPRVNSRATGGQRTLDAVFGALQRRIFDCRRLGDYAWLAVVGVAPIIVAYAIHAYHDVAVVTDLGRTVLFTGYRSRINWMLLPVSLPVALFTCRWAAATMFQEEPYTERQAIPLPIHLALADEQGKAAVTDELRALAMSWRRTLMALAITIAAHIWDMNDVLHNYIYGFDTTIGVPQGAFDWSAYFWYPTATQVTYARNATLVVLAYAAQFSLVFLGLNFVTLLLAHNVHYLRLIYQRERDDIRPEARAIVLRFDDDQDRCFGLRCLNKIFNRHLWVLVVAGALILTSRYANVPMADSEAAYKRLESCNPLTKSTECLVLIGDLITDPGKLFTTHGQWLLGAGWLLCFLISFVPALAKFLPLRSREFHAASSRKLGAYLIQYVPLTAKPRGATLTDTEATDLAKKFSRNSFWPAGDHVAQLACYFVFFTLVFVLMPLHFVWGYTLYFAGYVIAVAILSITLTTALFALLKWILRHVDPQLVTSSE